MKAGHHDHMCPGKYPDAGVGQDGRKRGKGF